MANLIPRDTLFRDLFDVRRNFDQAFNRFLNWPSGQEDRSIASDFSPAVESFIDTDNKRFHCEVLLPGVDPKNVHVCLPLLSGLRLMQKRGCLGVEAKVYSRPSYTFKCPRYSVTRFSPRTSEPRGRAVRRPRWTGPTGTGSSNSSRAREASRLVSWRPHGPRGADEPGEHGLIDLVEQLCRRVVR